MEKTLSKSSQQAFAMNKYTPLFGWMRRTGDTANLSMFPLNKKEHPTSQTNHTIP